MIDFNSDAKEEEEVDCMHTNSIFTLFKVDPICKKIPDLFSSNMVKLLTVFLTTWL